MSTFQIRRVSNFSRISNKIITYILNLKGLMVQIHSLSVPRLILINDKFDSPYDVTVSRSRKKVLPPSL